ncbi:UNVERIFIED_ORG: multiple antibiotic resistance protein [Burkholderia sp. CF145]|jgi:multiple antibiotic resistance protein|uniref:MarC family protein n=1 Tax=Paraburkholderia hospita TaxID=169430 RepID=UPI0002718223|nr:MarC family protein [Paraburkholderia hospita]EUC12630.1 multiple antibiotic resistance (MarC)-related protein [Burkholderia sp. BT03]SKC49635.1 multiple antibiotic resistance protein [Paraburkholderia hospita]SKD05699.1 multiple antibiotic resistance protein [Burkholderia sp. CF099]
MLNQFTETVLLVVAGLFPVINPPAAGFIVLTLVPRATPAERAYLAWSISLNSLIILLVSLSIGAYLLSFFGISLPALRVAGGMVIAYAGWNLLHAPQDGDRETDQRITSDVTRETTLRAKAFYPLTLPITVGPGSMAVAIALGTGRPRTGIPLVNLAGAAVGMAILWCSIYVCVRYAANVEKLLGPVGTEVAMRLFAFVLFCIGIQILWLGLEDLLETVPLSVRFK